MMKRKLLLTVAIALMSISNALAKEDVTVQYLTNADLTSLNGWTLSGSNNMKYGYYEDWVTTGDVPVIEFYHSWHWDTNVIGTPCGDSKTFRFSQKVTLPAGYYRLAVNAFYREGNGNGTNTKAYIFAGDKTQYVVGLPSSGVGAYSGSNDLYKAANAFSKGDFSNEFDFSVSEETEIEIGFDGYIDTYCSWCILGPVTLWEYTAEDYMEDYTEQVAIAEGLYDSKMNIDVLAALKEAASKGSSLVTVDDVTEAVKELKEAISAARASIADYEAIAAVNTKVALLDAAGQSVYQPFLDAYNAGTLTNEDIASVEDAYIDAFWAMTTYPPNPNTNMTPYIINPSFEFGYLGDWLSDNGGIVANNGNFGAAKGSFFVEKWVQAPGTLTNGTLLQKISGIPNGKYKVTAELQNREQGNGDVAGRGFFLFANSDRAEAITNNGETIEISTVVLDGSLTIGVQIEDCTGNWVCCDNFQLFFERELVVADYEESLADAVINAGTVQEGTITQAEYAALQATVTSYNKSYETTEEYGAAIKAINDKTAKAKAMIEPYTAWKLLKNAADDIVAANEKLQQKFAAFEAEVEAATDATILTQFVNWAQDLLNAYNDWMALKGKADILKEVANDKETANTAFKNAINTQTAAAVSALDEAEPDQAIAKVQAATVALKEAMVTYVGALYNGKLPIVPTIAEAVDATITVDEEAATEALPLDEVVITVDDKGYAYKVEVTNMDNESIKVNNKGGGVYSFQMPEGSVDETVAYQSDFTLYGQDALPVGFSGMSDDAERQSTAAEPYSGPGAPRIMGAQDHVNHGIYWGARGGSLGLLQFGKYAAESANGEKLGDDYTAEEALWLDAGIYLLKFRNGGWEDNSSSYTVRVCKPSAGMPEVIFEESVTPDAKIMHEGNTITTDDAILPVEYEFTVFEPGYYYVEFEGSAGWQCWILTSLSITSKPKPVGKANVKVSTFTDNVNLAINSAAKWGTFMSTFDFPIDDDFKAYTIESTTGYTLNLTPVEGEVIPANTPVVVESLVEGDVSKLISGLRTKADTYTVGQLTGVIEPTVPEEGSYVMQKKEEGVNFYRVPEGFTKAVPAFRAYLKASSNEINVFYFPEDEDVPTAIEGFDALTSGDFDAIYTASGVKVDALQKGLNIVVKGDKSYKIYVK